MKRKFLAAAAATAPLLIAAWPAFAQVTISTATTAPVKTSTANNGSPSDVTVAAGGSITVGSPGTDLTLDSNNKVTNAGALGATNQDNTIGLDIVGGSTGSATNTGAINITETYTAPSDPNNDGLLTGAFAMGTDRVGLEVSGSTIFDGSIINTGTITVQGNDSEGVSIQAPISGDFLSIVVTPATSTAAATVASGMVSIIGQNVVGIQITPTGGIGGDARIASVSATGPGAQAVQLNGAVGGFVNLSSAVVATGYRTTTRQTSPNVSVLYSQEQMQQGGAAVTLGANIGEGFIISAPPPVLSTTVLDQDGDGVPDSLQGTGTVISYGSSPAVQVGAVSQKGAAPADITLGAYTASKFVSTYNSAPPTQSFGLVNQGTISAQGLFDQLTSPFLLAPVSATAMQIGGQVLITPVTYTFNSSFQVTGTTPAVWGPTGSVTITGGIYNSGTISALAYQANATAIHIGADPMVVTPTSGAVVTIPTIYNDGQIFASSIQINSSTTETVNGGKLPNTPAPIPVNVTAILIEADSSVTTITNNSGIFAELTGTAGVGGVTTAILDKSGTVQTINNAGNIVAVLNNTLSTAALPTHSPSGASNTVAIDLSAGTSAQTINQDFLPLSSSASVTPYMATQAYKPGELVSLQGAIYVNVTAAAAGLDPITNPTLWREVGATSPSIIGDIYMGSGPDTLNIHAGIVEAQVISMGAGLNTISVDGTTAQPTFVQGAFTQKPGGQFQISVNNGTLSDLNPALGQAATTITIGATGVLEIAADPANNRNTQFITSGATTIAAGGQIGLTLTSLQSNAIQTYTVILGAPGSISAPALGPTSIGNEPFFYSAVATFVPQDPAGDAEVQLVVRRKTTAELGFNAAEASALDAILADTNSPAAANSGIAHSLLAQTTEENLKSVYDQLLPNQNQGIFEALDSAVEKISAMTGTPPNNANHVGGTSLWLQEVNERVHRDTGDTLGSTAQALGLVGGYERMGVAGGAVGVTLAYFNAQESTTAAQLGAHDVASLIEASLYYRRSVGNLTFSARGGGGYGWFSQDRRFVSGAVFEEAQADWTGDFIDAHAGLAYEVKLFGPYYARPEVSVDYLRLHQSGYQEHGTDAAFNLAVAPSDDTQASAQALMVLGRQWGRASWFRTELRLGYREVFDGSVGNTTANFIDGTPFTLAGDPEKGGWATVGFSLKSGSQFSYFALEGDADFRKGQQRYDLRVAGRSVF
ncbi:MAG TPA: autotransporter outer membrane beta-barrel domain-containing protein [Caulobacteraceae bacterium]|jgi:hypothetical protein